MMLTAKAEPSVTECMDKGRPARDAVVTSGQFKELTLIGLISSTCKTRCLEGI